LHAKQYKSAVNS